VSSPKHSILVIVALTATLSSCANDPRHGATEFVSQEKLSQDVEARLDSRADLGPPGSVRVEMHDSTVWLTGTVVSGLEKRLAESVARQTPGVTKVVNSIDVEHK
jgi:osmotically-inducible protein OsmY